MSAYSETVNVIMKSRVRESRTHGSVRGWHREVPVYSTVRYIYGLHQKSKYAGFFKVSRNIDFYKSPF